MGAGDGKTCLEDGEGQEAPIAFRNMHSRGDEMASLPGAF